MTTRALGNAAASSLPPLAGRHQVALAQDQVAGTVTLAAEASPSRYSLQAFRSLNRTPGASPFEQALGAAQHPHAGRQRAADDRRAAVSPDAHHIDRRVIVGLRGIKQLARYRHGGRGSDQADCIHSLRCRAAVSSAINDPMDWPMIVALRAPQASIRPPSSPPWRRSSRAARRPSAHVRAGRAPARQAAMGEPAGQQRPDRVIEPGAMQKDDQRQRAIERRARRFRRRFRRR